MLRHTRASCHPSQPRDSAGRWCYSEQGRSLWEGLQLRSSKQRAAGSRRGAGENLSGKGNEKGGDEAVAHEWQRAVLLQAFSEGGGGVGKDVLRLQRALQLPCRRLCQSPPRWRCWPAQQLPASSAAAACQLSTRLL